MATTTTITTIPVGRTQKDTARAILDLLANPATRPSDRTVRTTTPDGRTLVGIDHEDVFVQIGDNHTGIVLSTLTEGTITAWPATTSEYKGKTRTSTVYNTNGVMIVCNKAGEPADPERAHECLSVAVRRAAANDRKHARLTA